MGDRTADGRTMRFVNNRRISRATRTGAPRIGTDFAKRKIVHYVTDDEEWEQLEFTDPDPPQGRPHTVRTYVGEEVRERVFEAAKRRAP